MYIQTTLLALAAYAGSFVSAQACPELSVRVYGTDDTACGGASQLVTLQNLTCQSDGIT